MFSNDTPELKTRLIYHVQLHIRIACSNLFKPVQRRLLLLIKQDTTYQQYIYADAMSVAIELEQGISCPDAD
jgi:hypothetical protein